MNLYFIGLAVEQLCIGRKYIFKQDNDSWTLELTDDGETISRADIEARALEIKNQWNTTEYQRQRVNEYPSIGDQLDALFKAGLFPAEMAAQIQAVKDKYPKV